MQLYNDQIRNKHVSFHKEIRPAVKQMLLTSDTENDWKKTHYSKTASFHFFMKERHISKGYFT